MKLFLEYERQQVEKNLKNHIVLHMFKNVCQGFSHFYVNEIHYIFTFINFVSAYPQDKRE